MSLFINEADYPTLEFCKKMTELGFPRTEKYWFKFNGMPHSIYPYEHTTNAFQRYDQWCPSIAELLNELPKSLVRKSKADTGTYSIYISHDDVEYTVSYQNIYFTQGTLPDALAEMWIWLKQNDYLTK